MGARILVVQHQDICPPALVGTWLADAGADLQVRRPYAGERLPGDLTAYSGMLVLGGTMGAGDDATVPWLAATKTLVRAAAATARPTLGICLGHQLAAVALGGVVAADPEGKTVGAQHVRWSAAAAADPLLGVLVGPGTCAVQWNNDTVVELPAGALELARSARGRLQAARFAPTVWGVQWHPEAGPDVVSQWAARDRPTAAARGLDVDGALGGIRARAEQLRRTWRPLAVRFARLCEQAQGQPSRAGVTGR
ncbi:MAG: type 1 glutamine amidotransferase [Dermatophilaceae bacterium]